MTFEVPYVSYAALYIISVHLISCSNSRTSSHWKVNLEQGKVVTAEPHVFEQKESNKIEQDLAFSIITSCKPHNDGEWAVYSTSKTSSSDASICSSKFCEKKDCCNNKQRLNNKNSSNPKKSASKENGALLDCGKVANFTYYDHLMGIADRHSHPHVHDPNAIMTFSKNYKYGEGSSQDVNMDEVEKRLWKARREKPRTTELYNQIGNYWRVKGDSLRSVECFRKALSVSPNNADVLLNLARLLFNLQYLEDAIYLTKRSLDLIQADQSGNKNAWMQHYTLGEILRAYGHYHEASLHIRHVLDLNPNYQPAIAQLRDMETLPDTSIHLYTLCIIVFLVFSVLFGIIFSTVVNGSLEDFTSDAAKQPMHRRFNRAVAMRSIKMGMNMNPRSLRFKKYHT